MFMLSSSPSSHRLPVRRMGVKSNSWHTQHRPILPTCLEQDQQSNAILWPVESSNHKTLIGAGALALNAFLCGDVRGKLHPADTRSTYLIWLCHLNRKLAHNRRVITGKEVMHSHPTVRRHFCGVDGEST